MGHHTTHTSSTLPLSTTTTTHIRARCQAEGLQEDLLVVQADLVGPTWAMGTRPRPQAQGVLRGLVTPLPGLPTLHQDLTPTTHTTPQLRRPESTQLRLN